MFRGVSSAAVTLLLKLASKTSAGNGQHSRTSGHQGVFSHLAVQLGGGPPQSRNFQRGSDGEEAQSIDRPGRLKYGRAPSRQAFSIEGFRNPPHITAFIKQQKQIAIGLTRGPDPEAGLTSFCASMDGLLSRPGLPKNYIHFSAIVTAAAHIWTGTQRHPSFSGQADVSKTLEGLYQQCLQSLQSLLADTDAQTISNVLWSSATLSFNPDDVVPGMVHALTSRFLHFIGVVQEKQRPSAQQAANVLWALATMGHPAATAQVVGAICLHFACLTQHSDAQQHPTAQACANVLLALAKMGHSSAAATEMVDSVCLHFARLTQHSDVKQRPSAQGCSTFLWSLATMKQRSASATEVIDSVCLRFARLVESPIAQQQPFAQEVGNLVWALGTLKHTPPDDRLLDQLCHYMQVLLYSQDQTTRPNSQAVANTVWALAQLKHLPSHDVVTAMLDYLVKLCQAPSLQPDLQAISNCFKACAEFGLDMKPACVQALLKHFMEMPVSDLRYQANCNLAWSLAVMQCLDLKTFEVLLDKLTAKHNFSVQARSQSSSAQLNTAGTHQLYQALAWLSPPSGSKQMAAWFKLRSRLQTLAPEPTVRRLSPRAQTVLCAALTMQGVPYAGDRVLCGVYQAHAVLSPRDSSIADLILVLERPEHSIKNFPSRVLGHVAFKYQLLGHFGTVVAIPYNSLTSNAESMAVDIKAAVKAKTGLSLDSFS